MRLARIVAAAFVLLPFLATIVEAFPGYVPPDQRLDMARDESGHPARPPVRYDLPAGELRVTPSELVAGTSGQKIGFSVTLNRPVANATLHLRIPQRWLAVPESGVRAVRGPRLADDARGRAGLRRRGGDVALSLDRAAAGARATFDIVDNGIPAGTYRLRFTWVDDTTGQVRRAGSARVVLYAPTREPSARALSIPGVANNVSNDSIQESESFIAVTQGNPNRMVISINWSGTSMPAWVTNDGGQSWTRVVMPQTLDVLGPSPETTDICCDPSAAADALGNLWVAGLSSGISGPGRIVVNRIAAGETAFRSQSAGLPVNTNSQDKPMLTIDNTATSPTLGRLYAVWNEREGGGGINVVISHCDTVGSPPTSVASCDSGDNWSGPVAVTPTAGSYIYADAAVGTDGRVFVTWWDFSNANAIRGSVCGPPTPGQPCSTWSAPQNIAVLDSTGGSPIPFECPILAQPGGRVAPTPGVDVDHSPGSNGRVYVTWGDLTGPGSTRCDAPPSSTQKTWDSYVASAPNNALPSGPGTRLLTDAELQGQPNSDEWFQWLAVDQTTGTAWVDFYSTRDDATRRRMHVYARSVTPDTPSGTSMTLGALTRVSSAPSDYSGAPCCNFGNDYGDYTGIDATSGIAYPVWSDKSTACDGEAFAYVLAPGSAPNGGTPCPPPAPPPSNSGSASTPTPAPTTTAPPPPPPRPSAPNFTLSVPTQRPASVASRGLRANVRCTARCRLDAQLYFPAATARRLGLARGTRSLLVGSIALGPRAAGSVALTVSLSRSARGALGRALTATLELRIRARDATGVAARSRTYRVTLRRTGRSPTVVAAAARRIALSLF